MRKAQERMNQGARRPRAYVTVCDPSVLCSLRRQTKKITVMGDKDAGTVAGKSEVLFVRGRE